MDGCSPFSIRKPPQRRSLLDSDNRVLTERLAFWSNLFLEN